MVEFSLQSHASTGEGDPFHFRFLTLAAKL